MKAHPYPYSEERNSRRSIYISGRRPTGTRSTSCWRKPASAMSFIRWISPRMS